ncbi:MAG: ABC transporter permease, partial [Alphaproteobacteria bacterium]
MIAYVIRRLLQSLIVMLVVGFVAFSMFNFLGDPINNMVGQDATEEERETLRRALGLDQPFYVQFLVYLGNAVQGNFGTSYRLGMPVVEALGDRLPATLELVFCAAGLALLVGLPLGVYTGLNRDKWLSKVFLTLSLIGISLPTFLIGILLILIFAVYLGWLPSFGRGDVVDLGWWTTGVLTPSGIRARILPSVTLAL